MKNIKTTLIGLIAGGGISIDAIVQDGFAKGWHHALAGIAIVILGAFAKDYNTTGGTIKQ